jgi:hypothetical protein
MSHRPEHNPHRHFVRRKRKHGPLTAFEKEKQLWQREFTGDEPARSIPLDAIEELGADSVYLTICDDI